MVKRDVAGARIARASAWLADAERTFAQPIGQFVAATRERDLALFYLFLTIQECIDLAAHWVADAGWEPPDEAAGAFDVLAARGAVLSLLADSMRRTVGLRNRIAHGYALLDYERVHREARDGIPAIREFLRRVATEAALEKGSPGS
jgi:uncharacterized protein YutE (UPF0331/DUF86 family)